MGITKIGTLFAATTDPVSSIQQSRSVAQEHRSPVTTRSEESNDAVVLSESLRHQQHAKPIDHSEKEVRRAKVTELKGLVNAGEYKPPSKDVAASLLRDLL